MTIGATTANHARSGSSDAFAGHLPGSSSYRRTMLAMFAAGMATFVLLYATQAVLPEFSAAFGVSPAQATLTLSVTTAALAVSLLVAGPLSETFGRTRLILIAVWAAGVIALLCAFAPTWHALLGLRLALGIALAGLPAVATAYLREELHVSAQARAAGLYIGGTALGGMMGRLLTGPIADHFGWRWGLAAAAIFALLCAGAVTLLLPVSQNFRSRPASLHGIAEMVRGSLRDPALLSLYLIGGCAMGALVAVFNTLGFRLISPEFGLGLGVVSLLYLVYPLGTVSSTVSGRLADRLGQRAIMPVGCLMALAGVALTVSGALPLIVLGLAVLTAGFFVIHGLASGWVAARAHAGGNSASQAAAFYLFTYYVGSSVFGSLAGTAWSSAGWNGVALFASGLLAVTLLLAITLRHIPRMTAD